MPLRLERILLFTFFLLLPSQLAYHFWPNFSFLGQRPFSYLSPTVYFTDLLLLGLFCLWLRNFHWKAPPPLFVLFSIYLLFNVIFSSTPLLSLYLWFRWLFPLFLIPYFISRSALVFRFLALSLPLAVVWVSGLSYYQFLTGHSFGFPFSLLGESTFSLSTPDIAKISLGSLGLFLRPYATLPHPNALAGFLLVSLLLIRRFATYSKFPFWFLTSVYIVGSIAALLTFSRLALAGLFIAFLYLFFRSKSFSVKFRLSLLVFLGSLLLFSLFYLPHPDSFMLRLASLSTSYQTFLSRPLFGAGLGGYLPAIFPSQFQPEHLTFLLLLSELGLVGIFTLSLCVYKYRSVLFTSDTLLMASLLLVGITSLWDNYWFTLHQPRLLLLVLLGILFSVG